MASEQREGVGASADAETGSRPTDQAEFHRLGALRFDPAREEFAILEQLSLVKPQTILSAPTRKYLEAAGLIRSEPFGTNNGYVSYLTKAGAAIVNREEQIQIAVVIAPCGEHGMWRLSCPSMPRLVIHGKSPEELSCEAPVCIAALVNIAQEASAIAMEAGTGATPKSDATAEGGDSAGPKDIAQPEQS